MANNQESKLDKGDDFGVIFDDNFETFPGSIEVKKAIDGK